MVEGEEGETPRHNADLFDNGDFGVLHRSLHLDFLDERLELRLQKSALGSVRGSHMCTT